VARSTWGGLLGWAAIGTAVGVVAGLYAAETLAAPPERVRRLVRARPQPVRVGFLARLARQHLRDEALLQGVTIEVLPVSARTVELHGWVATRAQRAAAERAVRRVEGIESIINAVLVRGEDDRRSPIPDSA
jgi:hypothetical protein